MNSCRSRFFWILSHEYDPKIFLFLHQGQVLSPSPEGSIWKHMKLLKKTKHFLRCLCKMQTCEGKFQYIFHVRRNIEKMMVVVKYKMLNLVLWEFKIVTPYCSSFINIRMPLSLLSLVVIMNILDTNHVITHISRSSFKQNGCSDHAILYVFSSFRGIHPGVRQEYTLDGTTVHHMAPYVTPNEKCILLFFGLIIYGIHFDY